MLGRGAATTLSKEYSNVGQRSGHHSFQEVFKCWAEERPPLFPRSIQMLGRGVAATLSKGYLNVGQRSGRHSFQGVFKCWAEEWPPLLQRSILVFLFCIEEQPPLFQRGILIFIKRVATALAKCYSYTVATPFLKQKWPPLVLSLLKGF